MPILLAFGATIRHWCAFTFWVGILGLVMQLWHDSQCQAEARHAVLHCTTLGLDTGVEWSFLQQCAQQQLACKGYCLRQPPTACSQHDIAC